MSRSCAPGKAGRPNSLALSGGFVFLGRHAGIGRAGVLCALLLLALLFAGGVSGAAAEADRLYAASCPSVSSQTIYTRQNTQGAIILSIPGNWDLTLITLQTEGQSCLYLGKKKVPVPAGETVDLTPWLGMRIRVWDERQKSLGSIQILQGSHLPALFLTVDPKELAQAHKDKDYRITSGHAFWTEADGAVTYDGDIAHFKTRGKSTFKFNKKPYELKLASKASPGGMTAGKTWILLANYMDVSLLRNQVVLDMAREIGMPYALECVQTDVWVNGVYNGLYLVTEKVQIGKNRIDITDLEEATEQVNSAPLDSYSRYRREWNGLPITRGYLIPNNPEDITGGYIGMIDKQHRFQDNPVAGVQTTGGLNIRVREPTCPSEEQIHYFAQRMEDMHQALLAQDGVNPATGLRYDEYLDVTSFALKYILEEWCKNFDFLAGSQYLYKDSDLVDPLVYAGPAWDYDLCFGNMEKKGSSSTGAWIGSISRKSYNLYWLLSKQPDFMQRVESLWQEIFLPAARRLLEPSEDGAGCVRTIQEYADAIRDSAAMNYARWGVGKEAASFAGTSFDSAVKYLKKWIRERTDWMAAQ